MRIIAFDTASSATAVALCDPDAGLSLQARDDPATGERPRHASRLMPLAVALLERAGGGWPSLDRIAVGVGPGTFTGLRIGVATARGLGQGLGIPVIGVSTLHSLALNAEREEAGAVLAVLDARRGELFVAAWGLADGGLAERLLAPEPIAPDRAGAVLAALPRPLLAVGPGAIDFRAQLEQSGAVIPDEGSELHRVTAVNHCRLASAAAPTTPAEVTPQYLRLPDAEIARRTKP